MQNEIKKHPTLETYWNQELQGSAYEENGKIKAKEDSTLEDTKDHYGKTGSVVKWISPVPDDTTASILEAETKEFESLPPDFSENELAEAANTVIESADESFDSNATNNSGVGIY
jgi:hypothetical protein